MKGGLLFPGEYNLASKYLNLLKLGINNLPLIIGLPCALRLALLQVLGFALLLKRVCCFTSGKYCSIQFQAGGIAFSISRGTSNSFYLNQVINSARVLWTIVMMSGLRPRTYVNGASLLVSLIPRRVCFGICQAIISGHMETLYEMLVHRAGGSISTSINL